jgi:hypothetical protein
LEQILDATVISGNDSGGNGVNVNSGGVDDGADQEWMWDVLRTVLRPSRLRDGLRSLPQASHESGPTSTSSWGNVVERLHAKLQHPDSATVPAVSIVVFGGSTVQGVGSCVLPPSLSLQQSSSESRALLDSLNCA